MKYNKKEKDFWDLKKVPNKLRVSHYPNIPCIPFSVEVKDEEQAHFLINTLAEQHLFLFNNKFIPDYSNAIIVEMLDDDGEGTYNWVNYWNEKEEMEWDEIVETYFK